MELELPAGEPFHKNTIELNSGRTSFEYLLRLHKPKRVYMPKYTCQVVIDPLDKLNIEYIFYSLNEHLEIQELPDVQADELLLYINYFGIKNTYTHKLAQKYGSRMVADCTQSFYFTDYGESHAIYSPRKFFGVSDGGYLITSGTLKDDFPIDTSYQRIQHLLKRIDVGAPASYFDFMANNYSLMHEPIKQMSHLTQRLLASIDYDSARRQRNSNFEVLHEALKTKNQLDINIKSINGPYMYPLMSNDAPEIKQRLHQNGIFTASFWPSVHERCLSAETEYQLTKRIICLPLDQRYSTDEMEQILKTISDY